ncbi:hypothetical protein [Bailinhaonella thermotolerans]|uniref:Uncharacterized protein n=1 Tax=Bailinhaonella thermotolerans TaxID=1070861 RepID=A0A3A4AXN2_9ACTN|nr:hypothetical protein [Bailinhaonella thermotolerans]RJL30030.1 hypothetical protein D5H75_24130 [Bailinhaonella thermotolerans]
MATSHLRTFAGHFSDSGEALEKLTTLAFHDVHIGVPLVLMSLGYTGRFNELSHDWSLANKVLTKNLKSDGERLHNVATLYDDAHTTTAAQAQRLKSYLDNAPRGSR